jgi:hypothetical protein
VSTASSECSAEWNAMTDPRSVSLPEGRDERAEWPSGDRPAAPRRARPRAENAVAGLACVEAYGWHREPTPSAVSTLRAALATNVAASAAPYGYTVTLWSSGAILMASHGMPHVADVFAFLAGALAGFGLMATLAQRSLGRAELLGMPWIASAPAPWTCSRSVARSAPSRSSPRSIRGKRGRWARSPRRRSTCSGPACN